MKKNLTVFTVRMKQFARKYVTEIKVSGYLNVTYCSREDLQQAEESAVLSRN